MSRPLNAKEVIAMTSKPYKPTPSPLNGCMCQDGSCEACNRVVEAWEAMREALHRVFISRLVQLNLNAPDVYDEVDKALGLADEAAKGKP